MEPHTADRRCLRGAMEASTPEGQMGLRPLTGLVQSRLLPISRGGEDMRSVHVFELNAGTDTRYFE